MRTIGLYLLVAFLTLTTAVGAFKAYQYKVQHDAVVGYLYGDSGVKDGKGKNIPRVVIIDAVLQAVVEEGQKKEK